MTLLDWILVVGLNGSIILYVLYRARDTHSSSDWFLAGRTLPWWVIGLSLYATVIDSSDMVVDAGGAYQYGVSMFLVNWLGVVGGWFLLAHFVALPMYRAGMYTNAEYLEARFGPTARVLSVLVQVLYRTMVVGILTNSVFLSLAIIFDLSDTATWSIVVGIALLATAFNLRTLWKRGQLVRL